MQDGFITWYLKRFWIYVLTFILKIKDYNVEGYCFAKDIVLLTFACLLLNRLESLCLLSSSSTMDLTKGE